jgi:NADH dehydrogenase FAD-containing subunit
MRLSRRDLLKLSTVLAGLLFASTSSANEVHKDKKKKIKNEAPLAKAKGPRVVIVGGGWSGLSVAKNLKIFAPSADIVLVEQKDVFISCPISNLWLVDKVELDFITHDFLQAARNHDYHYFHATATGVDKKNSILHTSNGDIAYDYLMIAPGIDYDYSYWGADDALAARLMQEYPAAFKPGSEHMTLKSKIKNFKGGTFLLTVPAGNYRCLPAPYERACLIADYFKHNNIKGKVLLLDENNDITIKEVGFHHAFKTLYKEYITLENNAKIEEIDLDAKTVTTEFDTFSFDDASFYPHVRGGKFLEIAGLAKDSCYNKLEADMNQFNYEAKGYPNIFIAGDARSMGFSKSGNTANTEGQFVAKLIARKINKKAQIKWESPVTLCISAVSAYPERGIFIHSEYAYDKKTKSFAFATPVTEEVWEGKVGLDNGQNVYGWAKSLYVDMFG